MLFRNFSPYNNLTIVNLVYPLSTLGSDSVDNCPSTHINVSVGEKLAYLTACYIAICRLKSVFDLKSSVTQRHQSFHPISKASHDVKSCSVAFAEVNTRLLIYQTNPSIHISQNPTAQRVLPDHLKHGSLVPSMDQLPPSCINRLGFF